MTSRYPLPLTEEQQKEREHGLRIANTPECPTCASMGKNGFGPSHMGSPRCESGSLASGRMRSHCTCDTCF